MAEKDPKAPKDPGLTQEQAEREERERIEEQHEDLPRTEEGEGSGGTRTQTPDERRRDPSAPNVQPDPQTERPQMPEGTVEMNERLTAAERENRQLRETVDRLNAQDRHRRFSDMVMGRGGSTDGVRWHGPVEDNVSKLERLADKVGEDSELFVEYVAEHVSMARQLNEIVRQGPRGSEGSGPPLDGSVQAEIDMRVTRVLSEHKDMSLAEATTKVMRENPELYERYRRETAVKV